MSLEQQIFGADIGVFEAVHGSAPDIAGKGIANPTTLLLSAMLMLRYSGDVPAADRIMAALSSVLTAGNGTPDLGGTATTTEFGDAICRTLRDDGSGVIDASQPSLARGP